MRRFGASDPIELAEIIRSATELLSNRMRARDADPRPAAQRDSGSTETPANGVDPPLTETERRAEQDRVRGMFSPTTTRVPAPSEPAPKVASERIEVALVLGS